MLVALGVEMTIEMTVFFDQIVGNPVLISRLGVFFQHSEAIQF